ncbi:NACHT domain-containing protein [Enterococcus sp. BWR-S5]|nr:NACHT domain-containing protein [Enterococcus sp. BWR-S5]
MVLELITTTLLAYNLEQLSEGIVNEAVGKWEQFETKYNKNFKTYFQRCEKKYRIIRTILNDREQDLIKIYQPTSLFQEREEIKADKLLQFIDNMNYVWITGHGGQGKSTLLRYLMLKILFDEKNSKQKIPVYVELRKFNNEKHERRKLSKFIYSEMNTLGFDLGYDLFEFMLKKGRFLFLFDAYDEIISAKNQLFMLEFDEFMTKYDENNFLITSRKMPTGNLENVVSLSRLELKGFTKADAISFIRKVEYLPEIKEEFLAQLDEGLYEKYKSIASNPLLLVLMLKVFKQNPNFPKDISKFLIDAFKVLYEQHDAAKLSYQREYRSKFNEEQMLQFFSAFCFITYFHSNAQSKEFSEETISTYVRLIIKNYSWVNQKAEFSEKDIIYDFKVCLCLLYEEGQNYYFVHNIFQEFFAAYHIYQLSERGKKSFLSKYILSSNGKLFSNVRLFTTTFDYIYELDAFKNTKSLDLEILLPLIESVENSENFIDFHHYFIYTFDVKKKGSNQFELYMSHNSNHYKNRVRQVLIRLNFKHKYGNNYPNAGGIALKPLITLSKGEIVNLVKQSNYSKDDLEKYLSTIKENSYQNFRFELDMETIEKNPVLYTLVKKSARYKSIAEFDPLKIELLEERREFEKEELFFFEYDEF